MCPSGLAEYYQCNNIYIKRAAKQSVCGNYKLRRFWSTMRAKERETTSHIRELDGDLGNILISW